MRDNFKRWTETSANGGTAIKPLDPDCGECRFESDKRCFEHLVKMLQCLKAYEDTELAPEEVLSLRDRVAELEADNEQLNYLFKANYNEAGKAWTRVAESETENARHIDLLKSIMNYFDNPSKFDGTWPEFYSASIKQILKGLKERGEER